MWKWISIALGIFAILGVWGYRRNTVLPLRRLDRFLRARGVDFLRIRKGTSSYGWPSYVVVFDSIQESAAFQRSSIFVELIQEVRVMHMELPGFEAERALSIDPIVSSATDV